MSTLRSMILILSVGIPLCAYTPRQILTPAGLAIERWADSSFPIVWRLNTLQGSNVTGTRSLVDVVRSAFLSWANVTTARLSFSEGAPTTVTDAGFDGINLISISPTHSIPVLFRGRSCIPSTRPALTHSVGSLNSRDRFWKPTYC